MLVKAINSTHRKSVNRILHFIGLPIYATGIALVAGYFLSVHTNPISGMILFLLAIGLFLTGHKIEGNLRAMTLIILFKYFKSRKGILTTRIR
jgi:phosphatidylserine synthase